MTKKIDRVRTIAQEAFVKKDKLQTQRTKLTKQIVGIENSFHKMIQNHMDLLTDGDLHKYLLHTIGELTKMGKDTTVSTIFSFIKQHYYYDNESKLYEGLIELGKTNKIILQNNAYELTKPVKFKAQIENAGLGFLKQIEREKEKLALTKLQLTKEIQGLDSILDTLEFSIHPRPVHTKDISDFFEKNQHRSFTIADLSKKFPEKKISVIYSAISYLRSTKKTIVVDEDISRPHKYYYRYEPNSLLDR